MLLRLAGTITCMTLASPAAADGIVVEISGSAATCAIAQVSNGKILPATLEDVVRLGPTHWILQQDLRARAGFDGTAPTLGQDDCDSDPVVELGLQSTSWGIAYGGFDPAPPTFDTLRHGPWPSDFAALQTVLRDHFALPAGTPLEIQRVVIANLDGDTQMERLIEAHWEGITAADQMNVRWTSYDVLLLVEPGQPPAVLAGEIDGLQRQGEVPGWLELLALADLDGDGRHEVIYLDPNGELVLLSPSPSGDYAPAASCRLILSSCF